MAPKVDKNKQAAKAKAVEDKTFGMKNKKGNKQQQYIQQLKASGNPSQKEQRLAEPSAKDKKKIEAEKKAELDALFAATIKQPKIAAGVDPKSVLCEHFRHGMCTKGFKCKYSHDWAVERKGAKIDLFTDQRDKEENMDDWDQETLEKAIAEKHGKENTNNATAIICKHFLDAVERKLYGWFWKCPSGAECKYRHALPPGYVLKSQMKELLEEEAANYKDAAEVIEEERAKVEAKTPITEAVFRAWHYKKMEEKKLAREEAELERKKKGLLTGRELFLSDGFTATDADGADEEDMRRTDEDEIQAMLDKAAADARAAKEKALAQGLLARGEEEGGEAAPTTTLKLNEDEAAMFMDDDDDDEDMDDDDDEDLDAIEEGLKNAKVEEK